MHFNEQALHFTCHDSWLYGILSLPEQPAPKGVLVVVGGPQCRVGSHRQFTLLARFLAAQGIPVMRFDYRGMGDSEGKPRTFENIDEDIHSAINCFFKEVDNLKELVIWGLCDAASAALFYAHQDKRVTGLVLLNPWVRTDQGAAKAYLKYYYASRLFNLEFWKKIVGGKFNYKSSANSIILKIQQLTTKDREKDLINQAPSINTESTVSLPERMLAGLNKFNGEILIITSGNDLTAKEFTDLIKASKDWQKALKEPQIKQHELPDANHTFSRHKWSDEVAITTHKWFMSW